MLKRHLLKATKFGIGLAAATIFLSGCGGGGGSTPAASTPATSTLSGVAAIGSPIVGGTISVSCASGSALTATTNSTGNWQVTLTNQTLPCAVEVSGGTINGAANPTPYHSIATAAGTVNVTPLTDLMVANLAGTATPGTWFTGLTPAQLAAITQAQVDASLVKLGAALSALPIGANNPVTMTLNATPGTVGDNMLVALSAAMTNAGVTYPVLLGNASAPAFAPPAGLGSALTAAYAGGGTGGGTAIPAVPSGVSATASSATQININWTNVTGATAYNIYRSTTTPVQIIAANKITPAIAQPTAGPFPSNGLTAATTYYYKVTAVNAVGESIGSAEVSATTLAAGAGGTPTPVAGLMGGAKQGTALALAGTVSTFAGKSYALDGTAALATFNTPRGITSDGTNLYVVDTINQRIRKTVIATGATTTLAGTGVAGATDGPGATATFVLDTPLSDGITNDGTSLYVLDASGSKIRKIDMGTGAVSTLVPSTGTVIAKKIIAVGGALYGAGLNRIIQINTTTGAITTVAGSLGVSGALDGTGTAATFGDIYGIASDGTNLYVSQIISGGCCTPSTYEIRKVAISTWAVTTLPLATYTSANNTVSPLSVYGNLTTDGVNLYLSPLSGGLYKINMATGASTLPSYGNTTLGGLAIVGADLFATDVTNNQIQRVATATGVNTSLVGMAGRAVDGPGLQATFGASLGITGSTGVTTDGTNLYVADSTNKKIRKIVIATGDVTTLALTNSAGLPFTFSANPQAITTDGVNLYVSDGYLRIISIATGIVTTPVSVSLMAGLNASSLTTDGISLYATQPASNTIAKINLATLTLTTFAGSGVLGTADGTGTLATFSYPVAVTTDGTNLYVADRQSNLIRKIVIATGVVTTVTTTPAATISTPFYVMNGITTDGINLYVTGGLSWYSMDGVWKMNIATGVTTKVAGAPSADNPDGITTDGTSLFFVNKTPRVISKIQ